MMARFVVPLLILLTVIYESQSKCSTSMHLFIEAAVQFERCSMKNAVPATICSFCLTDYLYLLRKYNEFVKDSDVKYFGTSCASEVTDQNRLNIIPNHLAAIKNLWNVANCANCYTNCDAELTKCDFSDTYIRYNASLNQIDSCFDRSRHIAVSPCQYCATEYANLSQTYESAAVCYDIEDGLLNTRKLWVSVMGCDVPPAPSPHAGGGIMATICILFALAVLGGGGFAVYRQNQIRTQYRPSSSNEEDLSLWSQQIGRSDSDL